MFQHFCVKCNTCNNYIALSWLNRCVHIIWYLFISCCTLKDYLLLYKIIHPILVAYKIKRLTNLKQTNLKLIQHNILQLNVNTRMGDRPLPGLANKYPVWQPTEKMVHGPSIYFKYQNMVHVPSTIVMWLLVSHVNIHFFTSNKNGSNIYSNSVTIQLLITVDDHQLEFNSIWVRISFDMSNCNRHIGNLYFSWLDTWHYSNRNFFWEIELEDMHDWPVGVLSGKIFFILWWKNLKIQIYFLI